MLQADFGEGAFFIRSLDFRFEAKGRVFRDEDAASRTIQGPESR
jgi:hypothetical protein